MIKKIILLCGILLAGTSQAAVINKEEIALNNVINSLINEDYEVFKNGGKLRYLMIYQKNTGI
ncbi:hypothetical protein A3Q29_16535 [Providencia stuartii]|uniref:Uncharacterized protein n=1 Tax=Providencia stuartii TaxID=588 RepID=A0A1S1HT27_PROST|nr:hypothetical protein A3Q29_16535 [Providencia stuartii]